MQVDADASEITRYAPNRAEIKCTNSKTKYECSKNGSPVHCPSILSQELLTSSFESIVWPQILNSHGDSGDWIHTSFLDILNDADAIIAHTRWGNNRIMHDLKRDAIDQVVRNNLVKSAKLTNP